MAGRDEGIASVLAREGTEGKLLSDGVSELGAGRRYAAEGTSLPTLTGVCLTGLVATADLVPDGTADLVPDGTVDLVPDGTADLVPDGTADLVPDKEGGGALVVDLVMGLVPGGGTVDVDLVPVKEGGGALVVDLVMGLVPGGTVDLVPGGGTAVGLTIDLDGIGAPAPGVEPVTWLFKAKVVARTLRGISLPKPRCVPGPGIRSVSARRSALIRSAATRAARREASNSLCVSK